MVGAALSARGADSLLDAIGLIFRSIVEERSGGIAFPAMNLSAHFGFATPHLQICADLSFAKSLTLLGVDIVARAQAGARTTKQLRAELWIRRIQPMEQNPKVEYANVSWIWMRFVFKFRVRMSISREWMRVFTYQNSEYRIHRLDLLSS